MKINRKIPKKILLLFLSICLFSIQFCTLDKGELIKPVSNTNCDTTKISYCYPVQKIIYTNCTSSGCHKALSSAGDLTTYQGVKLKIDNGSFKIRVLMDKDMPPESPLSSADIETIDAWIKAGAPEQ